jgi:transposase
VSVLDGNASDHAANRFHIDELAGLLPPQDEVTLVADCKMCDPTTLGRVLDAAFHFVTLVPRTYKLRGALVEEVLERGEALPELVREPGETARDPDHVYAGVSFVRPFTVFDPEAATGRRK